MTSPIPPGRLQQGLVVPGAGGIIVSAATWSAIDKNSHAGITGAGLIATAGQVNITQAGRGTTATTAVGAGIQRYSEFTITATPLSSCGPGVANVSNTFADNEYLGLSVNSLGYYPNGQVFVNNVNIATIQGYAAGAIIRWACKGGSKLWLAVDGGGWNNDIIANQNPATNTGGIDISALGTVYPAYTVASNGGVNEIIAANFGPTFAFTPPAGYTSFP